MNLGSETETLEFKESTSEMYEALIDITAMLNKHGWGELYFGVFNNGNIKGMQIGEETKRDISRKIFENIKPQIYPVINELEYLGKKYIRLTFEGSSRPYSCEGKYYIRVSDESRELSPLELTNMILNFNYEKSEKMVSDCTIDDIDENSVKNFYNKALNIKRLSDTNYDVKSILNKLNLIYKDGKHLNNAGKMLFSAKKPISIKMGIFATNEKKRL